MYAVFAVLFLPPSAQAAESVQTEITKATLVTRDAGIVPGQPFQAGIVLESKDGWHTYWENPGDAGMATSLKWTLPQDFSVSPIDWPAPERLAEGPLVIFAYEHPVLLPVTITPPASIDIAANYLIKVHADWLACKDICIPESADLEIALPATADAAPGPAAHWFNAHQKKHAKLIAEPGEYAIDGGKFTLSIPLKRLDAQDIRSALFFPRQENMILYPAAQALNIKNDTLHLSTDATDAKIDGTISGLLSVVTAHNEQETYDITLAPSIMPMEQATPWLPTVLLFALLGGLILNLMPCVLPVLSLKALAIAKKAGHEHRVVVRHGIAYTAGILVSFAVIAAVLLALREGGAAVGWGFQMQSPAFVAFLAYLLFMVGLNLSGVFELPVLLGNVGGELAGESSARGSFFTGVLATAVATPCTAPFMASAVGIALTLPAWEALLIFEMLGFGLALPFLLISLFPALRKFIPRPGAWMETFRHLLAFPMYGSVIWLLWVLTLQTGAGGMVVALTAMLFVVMIIWMKALFKNSGVYRIAALLGYAAILALSLPMLTHMENANSGEMEHGVKILPFSKEALEQLRNQGKPVFVDATAAWCITCQVNARVAIHTQRSMDAFRQQHVTLMIADWTRRNDDITEFLTGFGYKGVPLYVFYPANGGKPVVLPQLLTESNVISTITKGE